MDIALYFVVIVLLSITHMALMARMSRLRLIAPLKWFLVSVGLLPLVVYWAGRISIAIEWRHLGAPVTLYCWETLALSAMLAGSVAIWIACRRGSNWFGRRPTWQYGLSLVLLLPLAVFIGISIESVAAAIDAKAMSTAQAALSEVLPAPIDPKDNAAPLYEQFARAVDRHGDRDDLSEIYVNGLDDPAFAKAINDRRELLVLARKAADMPAFQVRHEISEFNIQMHLPYLSWQRMEANELSYTARWEAHTGDLETAIKDANRVYRVAWHARNNPMIAGSMVSQGIYNLADKNMIDLLPLLQDRKQLASIKLAEAHFKEDMIRALKSEDLMMVSMALDAENPYPRPVTSLLGYNTWRRLAQDSTLGFIRRSSQMGAEAMKHLPGEPWSFHDTLEVDINRSGNRVASIVVQIFSSAVATMHNTEASRRAVEIAIAQTRYRLDQGSYTDDPTKLVPAYLPNMPIDPFDGKPMRMKLQADGSLLIYSVGADRKDDAGNISFDPVTHKQASDVGIDLETPLTAAHY